MPPRRDDDILGLEIDCTIESGRNLVAKDGTGLFKMGAKTTSDPYVVCNYNRNQLTQTEVAAKTLAPTYNHAFKFVLEGKQYKPDQSVIFAIADRDRGAFDADDPMGEVRIPVRDLLNGKVRHEWFKVENCSGCSNASGELKIKISALARRALTLEPKASTKLGPSGVVAVGLGWEPLAGKRNLAEAAIDLDTSCVALGFDGKIVMDESVYFAQLVSRTGAIRHTGDEMEGDEDLGQGDDEIIVIDLGRVPARVCALYLIGTVASEGKSFADVKSAKMRLVDMQTGIEKCRFYPGTGGPHTAVFLGRIARTSASAPWSLQAIGEYDHTARDWGTLVPEVQMYSQDIVPGIKVNMADRVAIMRKGGLIRVKDYTPSGQVPEHLVMGLSWDITQGRNIDLDASALLLDAQMRQIDLVFFGKLGSSDGAVRHGGDEREGDEKGDDEKIFLQLGRVHPAVAYIGFVINSYSGEELDDVKDASCHLYDGSSYRDLASFKMANCAFLDKHTALVVGMLFRDLRTGEWAFEIISEAAQGRTAHDNVDELQRFIQRRVPTQLPDPRLAPGAGGGMLARGLGGI